MRPFRIAVILFALGTSIPAISQQTASGPADEMAQFRGQLDDAIRLLQQTRAELQASREEVRALRAEVEQIKSPHPVASAQPEVSQTAEQQAEAQSITDSRIEQIYQSKVESGSKYRVKFSGLILFNAGMNRGTVDNSDVPMLALRRPAGQSGGDINATMRQTLFDVGVTGPDLLGARTSADVQFDFFGGFTDTLDGTALGLMRLRTAHAQLQWEHGSLIFGQDQPFISPLSPTSLASLGTPAFGYSGNLWTWAPQVVAARDFAWTDSVASQLQVGVLDPFSGQYPPDTFERIPSAGERSRVPAFAARHSLSFKVADRKFTIGTGGYYSRQNYGFGHSIDAFAGTLDWMLPLSSRFEVSGEFFRGRAIGGMWGGIGTSVVMDGPSGVATTDVSAVNSVGGWTQLKFKPAPKWELNTAFGIDNPYTRDLRRYAAYAPSYRPTLRNSTGMFNIMNHPRSNLVLSLEYRHLNTVNYGFHRYSAENINLGIGVHF